MATAEETFRLALEAYGDEGAGAAGAILWSHFEEMLALKASGQLPDWKVMLQDAVAAAADAKVPESELDGQFDEEVSRWYVNNGDQENPDPDNVYDMIKDKELNL